MGQGIVAVVLCFWFLVSGCAVEGKDRDDSMGYPSPCNDAYCILDSSQALQVNRLPDCTRNAPVVEGGWQMSAGDGARVDSAVLKLEVVCILYELDNGASSSVTLDISKFYRQYVGVVYQGKRMIYVNATYGALPADQRSQLEFVCDGGPRQWGALWDPVRKEFSYVECNAQG